MDWSPSGVCALVGPNGSGKTTILDVPALLGDALEWGLARALEMHGGVAYSRNVHALPDQAYDFTVSMGEVAWKMAPFQIPYGFRPAESVDGASPILRREAGADSALIFSQPTPVRDVLGFRVALDQAEQAGATEPAQKAMLALGQTLRRYRLYQGYDVRSLRRNGSTDSAERRLAADGTNVFSLLRNWRDRGDDLYRYEFVLEGLRDMFADFFLGVDFSKAAQVIGAELRLPDKKHVSASLAPDGWFVALLHLAAVASTDPGDVISIDEPENALHPHAIKLLLELMREWSRRHSTTILLATHSPVILDAFREDPDRLYVMEPAQSRLPVALSELKEPSWLAHFSLGDLYAREEFGAPVDGDANRTDHHG